MDEFLNRLKVATYKQLQTSHAQDSDTIEVTECILKNSEHWDESLEYNNCYGPYKQDSTSTKKRLVLG